MSDSDFLSKHSDWKNVYYDDDLRALRSQFKKLQSILDAISKRFERHETIQIAKSVFDYVTSKEMALEYPHTRYCMACGDVKIFIKKIKVKNSRRYCVCCLGYLPNYRHNQYRNDFGYYDFESLEEAIKPFLDICHEFTSEHLESLF